MTTSPAIIVRPFLASDADSFFAAVQASLPELSYWMPWCHPQYSLPDAQAWIAYAQQAWLDRREFPFGIFDAGTHEVIGGTGINQINKAHRIGNIGYWVSTAHTGRGVAKAAARQVATMGFSELGLTRLEIVALTHNTASQRVALSVGATQEGIVRNRLHFQGAPRDAHVFSLIPTDVHIQQR